MSDIIKVRNGNSWIGVPSMAGAPGPKGADGVSPTFSVVQTSTGADLTITDANGTHTVSLSNGPQGPSGPQGEIGPTGAKGDAGEDGVSPTFSVAQTSTGADLTITDANGTHTVSLFNGPKGEKGDSPIKGIDYWTTSDQDEVVAAAVIQVLDRLPSAENNSY